MPDQIVPAQAPVTGAIDVPQTAPVSDFVVRTTQGVELTKFLLMILSGSIIILVAYLWTSDWRASDSADSMYEQVLISMRSTPNSPELNEVRSVSARFKSIIQDPNTVFGADRIKSIGSSVREIVEKFHLLSDDVSLINQCSKFLVSTPNSSAPSPQNDDKIVTLKKCSDLLDSIESAKGSSMDLDRLRLMKDFAKDVSDSHQALRTFWISAVQLVLVNVLLPLLTALLGYIFGRQASQS